MNEFDYKEDSEYYQKIRPLSGSFYKPRNRTAYRNDQTLATDQTKTITTDQSLL
jgi:hypothetical protein